MQGTLELPKSFLLRLVLHILVFLMKRTESYSKLNPKNWWTRKVVKTEVESDEPVEMPKDTLHVEICQASSSSMKKKEIEGLAHDELQRILNARGLLPLNTTLTRDNFQFQNTLSLTHIQSLHCSTGDEDKYCLHYQEFRVNIKYHLYRLNEEEAAAEIMEKDGEEISASTHWILPSVEFHQLWDNLFYNDNIKEQLLQYIENAMICSERQINPHVISWNKVIFLHGPPGTGKTSLCKALAQKITIRLSDKFQRGQLVEINSHILFSKWFSESGKLVMNLFNKIKLLLQEETTLVCILIDEVESLAHACKSCANGSEPSDSIRVVNALLTQFDNFKRHPNVLILTTSNLTEAIDVAFVDRADIKQLIPHPNEIAIYQIYYTCVKELMAKGLIKNEEIQHITLLKYILENKNHNLEARISSLELYELAKDSVGLSGRTLRKIPFLAHTLQGPMKYSTLRGFIKAMHRAVENELMSREEAKQ